MFFNVGQKFCSQLSYCINGLQLDVKCVQPQIEYLETRNFEEVCERILEESVECFSQFISAGYFLFDEKLGEISNDVLKFDLKRALLFIKHLSQVDSFFLFEEIL